MKKLTKDADTLICLMYKQYLESRKADIPKSKAKYFGSSHDIQSALLTKEAPEDVDETCRELDRAEYIYARYYDDEANDVTISDEAIIYMENRFKDGLVGVIDFLSKFKPW